MCNEKLIPSNMNFCVVCALDSEQINAARKKDVNRMVPTMERHFPSEKQNASLFAKD